MNYVLQLTYSVNKYIMLFRNFDLIRDNRVKQGRSSTPAVTIYVLGGYLKT